MHRKVTKASARGFEGRICRRRSGQKDGTSNSRKEKKRHEANEVKSATHCKPRYPAANSLNKKRLLGIPSILVMHLVRHPKAHQRPILPSHNTSLYASTDTPLELEALALRFLTAPGLLRVYLANARARAFLQETFWLPTKLSTATAMARSISEALQYSESRILAKASEIRRMDSR